MSISPPILLSSNIRFRAGERFDLLVYLALRSYPPPRSGSGEENACTVCSPPLSEPGDSKTILIAEDNESNSLLLHCILKKNYRLERANNGKEAVELSRSIRPDLILMDIKMPVMDGLEATRLIRQEDHKVPIVALTAYAYPEDKKRAEEEGCNAFLTKPIDRKQLWEVLQELGL